MTGNQARVALPLAVTLAVQMLVAFAVYCAPVMAPVAGPALGFAPSAVGYYIAITYCGSMIGSAAAGGWVGVSARPSQPGGSRDCPVRPRAGASVIPC